MKGLLTPRQAAIVPGVSDPTVKLWICKHKLRAAQTPGDYRIPQSEIDKFLPKRLFKTGTTRHINFWHISGRNQLVGRIVDMKISGLLTQVALSFGGQHITSIITADAVREMRLKKGETVAALIKSTEVMILRL